MSAIELLKAECNRYVNGLCSTRRCVKRGMEVTGATFPLTDYAVSTCEYHEAVQEIERLSAELQKMKDKEAALFAMWRECDAKNSY